MAIGASAGWCDGGRTGNASYLGEAPWPLVWDRLEQGEARRHGRRRCVVRGGEGGLGLGGLREMGHGGEAVAAG